MTLYSTTDEIRGKHFKTSKLRRKKTQEGWNRIFSSIRLSNTTASSLRICLPFIHLHKHGWSSQIRMLCAPTRNFPKAEQI